jgi:hypothetical protein
VKKIRGDKPIGVIIHIYMKITKGNSWFSSHYSKKLNCNVFVLSFLFCSTKSENRRTVQVLPRVGYLAPVGGRRC